MRHPNPKNFTPFSTAYLCAGGGIGNYASQLLGFQPTIMVEPDYFARLTFSHNAQNDILYNPHLIENTFYQKYKENISVYAQKLENLPSFSYRDVEVFLINLEQLFLAEITTDCHDFTSANDKADSTSQRAQGIYYCLNFVEDARPLHIFIENVKRFVTAQDHNRKQYLKVVLKRLKEMGYNISVDRRLGIDPKYQYVYNSADFLEGQNRERFMFRASLLLDSDSMPSPTPLGKIDFGKVLSRANLYGNPSDTKTSKSKLNQLIEKPIGIWHKKDKGEKTRATTFVLRPDGKGQTPFIGNLDKYYIYKATKFLRPWHISRTGIILTAFDDLGNPLFERLSIADECALFSLGKPFTFPKYLKRVENTKKLQLKELDIQKPIKQRILGNGIPNRFKYEFIKDFIPKNVRESWSIKYIQNGRKKKPKPSLLPFLSLS